MCGIVGIASKSSVVDETHLLAKMRDAMLHRGPDNGGLWWSADRHVGLAHRRLAIIDLSPMGHQPMLDANDELCIVFNGEIYNFQDLREDLEADGYPFRSSSDTEVILAAYRRWGTDCLQHFNGMFAFALYDGRERRLFIARDRAGEKPLFYRLSDGKFAFASELKALMADPDCARRLNREALDCYLAFGYVPGDRCILQGVNKLPPAHALMFDLETGRAKTWRYWHLPSPPDGLKGQDPTDLLDELEHLLEDAVRCQLVADVPVGILLSGGVDSSLVTAMAVRSSSKVKTFTICFPGYGKYDETDHARLIARHFGTDHVELEAEPSSVELLPMLARQFDEPMVDSSMIPTYLVSKLVRQHCTVALGGDGGDELFAGYDHYRRLLRQRAVLGSLPLPLRKMLSNCVARALPPGVKGRSWLQWAATDFRSSLPCVAHHFGVWDRPQLLAAQIGSVGNGSPTAESLFLHLVPRSTDILQRATRFDFQVYLPEDILTKVDRASMLNSLEVRAPWLDYRIVEFAFGKVGSLLKAGRSGGKLLPKRLAERLLPPDCERQRKQGFSIPLAAWLATQPWKDYFREVLLSPNDSFYNNGYIERLLQGQALGRSNSERLFALVLLELWRREYRVSP